MINKNRIIPILLLKDGGLYKTFQFKDPKYIGDPINTINIFNEKKVDELIVLDISREAKNKGPNFELLADIANEAFFPIAYGGGIENLEQATRIMELGFYKLSFCSAIYQNPLLVEKCVKTFGAQSVVGCLDVKVNSSGEISIYINNGNDKINWKIEKYISFIKQLNIGELILNDIQKDGTFDGYNFDLLIEVNKKIQIPMVASGGAKSYADIASLFSKVNISAAAGALFVYYGPYNAVLISYPSQEEKLKILNAKQ
ncbi:MAG: HisA/HisF-related TIM barrel protein [Gammaproteobacteria bacterium]